MIKSLIQINRLIILNSISNIYNDDSLKKDFSKCFRGGDKRKLNKGIDIQATKAKAEDVANIIDDLSINGYLVSLKSISDSFFKSAIF